MEVYHGSYTKIDKIDLSKGQLNRDFGVYNQIIYSPKNQHYKNIV